MRRSRAIPTREPVGVAEETDLAARLVPDALTVPQVHHHPSVRGLVPMPRLVAVREPMPRVCVVSVDDVKQDHQRVMPRHRVCLPCVGPAPCRGGRLSWQAHV